MKRDYTGYIADILDAIEDIREFIEDIDYDTFSLDKKTTNAVIKSLEVIGEAATKIPIEMREQYPQIPWKRMAGMRTN